jgi:hypothetical protein
MPEHRSEAARIGQSQQLIADGKVEVIVLFRRHSERQYAQVSGHAEMYYQSAMIESDQQILAASPGAADLATAEPLREVRRERPAQSAVPHRDGSDNSPFKVRRYTASGHFDFWQLRHGKTDSCGKTNWKTVERAVIGLPARTSTRWA